MKIEKFEDIQAWQKARQLITEVYKVTTENERFSKDFGLKEQIRRASVSIMSNIAEVFARQTNKEFSQFLHIALGSVAEVQSQLYVAQDLNYVSKEEFGRIYELSSEVARLVTGFIKYLQGAQR